MGQSEIAPLTIMETGSDSCHICGMTEKKLKRPRDPSQLAKAIVDMATMDEAELKAFQESLKKRRSRQADLPAEEATDSRKR